MIPKIIIKVINCMDFYILPFLEILFFL